MSYPLSQSQLGIFLACRNARETDGNYQLPFMYKLPDDIDPDRLAAALEAVVRAHPTLLARIVTEEGEPRFQMPEDTAWKAPVLETDDISKLKPRAMDLDADTLFRMEIYRTPGGNYLYLDFHHIAVDGLSYRTITDGIAKAYDGETLVPESVSGFDIALEEEERRRSPDYGEAAQWFAATFGEGAGMESDLLPDVYGEPEQPYRALTLPLAVTPEQRKAALEHCNCKESVLLTTAFGVTLGTWCGETHACFSTIWNGRASDAVKDTVSMCVHTQPVWLDAPPEMPLHELLDKMTAQAAGLRERAFYSFGDCIRDLDIHPTVNFAYQGSAFEAAPSLPLGGHRLLPEDLRTNPPGIGLGTELFKTEGGGYEIRFWYAPNRYSEAMLREFAESLSAVIVSMAAAGTAGDLDFSTPAQLERLDGFNPGPLPFDADATLPGLFRDHARKAPEHIAVVHRDKAITYGELDRLSDNLAARIAQEVEPGSVVAILPGRDEMMAIAPLGALKAACAYIPLDASYPVERLKFMMDDAGVKLLIADPSLKGLLDGQFEGSILTTDEIASLPDAAPGDGPAPDDLCVLLYTSGTTGTPKGCMLTERNIAAYVRSHAANVGIGPDSRLTAYASFGFDAFVGDLYGTLCNGAALHVVPEEIRLDLSALNDWMARSGITHAFMTTQVATQFALNYPDAPIKVLFMGGEKMAGIPLPSYEVFNCYGPTESICYVISKHVTRQEQNVPIGRPHPGIHAYVVSKGGKRLPAGAAGELLEAGIQVGPGYLGRPEKTAEAFLDNPYEDDPAFRPLYRTGDIVRYRPDGDIEYVGRKDAQVKIRGFRIELSEVEAVIREFPGIADVTVQAFDEEGEGAGKFLAAYFVSDDKVDTEALADFILERKPPYMVPACMMQIEAIPLNVNQKVDRKALPKPQAAERAHPSEEAPFNLLEQEIAELISASAHIEGISLTVPLFRYGLSSLSALRLATELYKKYGVSVDMKTFVKTATLQSIENGILAVLLQGSGAPAEENAVRADGPQELTWQQQGLYIDCMKAPHETFYNIPAMWTFPPETDPERLRKALIRVLECHPYVNTHFEMRDGKVFQVPVDAAPEVAVIELEEGQLQAFRDGFAQPFNLSEGPLYRISIVKTGGALYLFTDFHHLIFDGQSCDVFMKAVTAVYDGKEPEKEPYSYFAYAADQKKAESGAEFAAARDYFAGRMAGCEGASGILPDLPAGDATGREATLVKPVDGDIAARCRDLGISEASYFLAAAFLAVGAFCGRRNVHICTISNGRSDLRTADTLGMFVNTLALASDPAEGDAADYLRNTDRMFAETRTHEYYPFARLSSDFDFQPQVMFAYQVGVLEEYTAGGGTVATETLEISKPKFPVSIFIFGESGHERIVLQYDDARYSEALMRHFADTMGCIVRGLLADGPLDRIPLVADTALLDGFNRYSIPVDTTQTIVSLFRARAAKEPDRPAVACQGKVLTYKELDEVTDRIAAYVASLGLGREDVVSVLIGRSERMAVASLGVLKAGCAYQPLDPSYPEERLNFMIADASAKLLIADAEYRGIITGYDGPVLDTADIASLPEGPLPEGPAPESLFILLYTSGSTGVPKGCMLEHRNLVNFCAWYRNYYGLTAESRVAAYASYGFDACMMDLYPALTTGACVHIIPEDTRHDMAELDRFITENGITHSFMTTQVGVMFARNYPQNPSLKHLSVGGEKLVSMDPPSYGFHNGYGPTECTIFSTIFDVREKEPNIPIGHPLGNVRLYVTDPAGRRLPPGAVGELWISGPQVGRGYLNRPEKTAETYIPNPFATEAPYDRVYRTGDIVRYRTDGEIEFVGRNDGQVKIRGFRVETKEVEAVIREYPGVKDVTVQAFDSPSGGKFIAAYVVCDGELDAKAVSAFIRERKPPYMVPAAFTKLDRIPLNVNQKVDRKALPAPVVSQGSDYVEPANATESALCGIFAEILGMERVGATDNFFDLGGSSLMVTSVLVSAEKQGLHFAYGDVFAHPTARELAAFLGGESTGGDDSGDDVASYDYTAIDKLLASNTVEAFVAGKRQAHGRNILLTGATGFLGIHVLRELIEQTGEDTVIWCLLRGKGALTPERRLSEMLVYYFEKKYRDLIGSRIRMIQGDITGAEVFDALLASGTPFDEVFNCAANVKHFSRGNDILNVNYIGVKNLVRFCEAAGARLIQVSTESVGGMNPGSVPAVMTEQMLWFRQNTDNQYVHSKFLAERHILEHVAAGTLHAKILRAGNLSPRATDGEFQINFNSNSAMGSIKAYRMLGACPYPLLSSRMEFSPIDQTARAVVLLSTTPEANCVFHVSNDHLLPMDDILSRLHKEDGSALDYLETDEFIRRLSEAKDDPEKARILSSILAYAQAEGQEQMVMNESSTLFSMQVLHRLGFRWDETSSEYVDMIFDMLASLRFFNV